jgi:energy-coupling factor transporter ATP-binding protein EcfA2
MSSFTPATRTSTKARIALCGPSGSGKTWTALTLAHALGDRIAVIDTERGSASKYAGVNGWAFQTVAPGSFAPDALTGLLAEAGGDGFDVLVLDSWSHYWMGVDGMLEQVDRRARNGNNFSGWKEVRPDERRMIDALISYPGHVIATLRVKTEYVIEENDRGKKVPRKIGLKPEQREGIEYEFDLVGDMDHDNNLTVSKSRIPALTRAVIKEPDADLGKTIRAWLEDGETVPDARELREKVMSDEIQLADLIELAATSRKLGIDHAAVPDNEGKPLALIDLIRDRYEVVQHRDALADKVGAA